MKKIIISILCLMAIVLVFFVFSSKDQKQTVKLTDMPWQIEISPDGHSRVFGIELGQTTLANLQENWRQFHPEIGLFTDPDLRQRLEAYLGTRRLGYFDAKVILGLEASTAQLAAFAQDKINLKPMPSGDYKQEITEDHILQAYQLPISSITYIPSVKYDQTLLKRYFSEPRETIVLNDKTAFWLYPDKGLAVLLDTEGKEVFHYVVPDKFAELLQHLKLELVSESDNRLPATEADNLMSE